MQFQAIAKPKQMPTQEMPELIAVFSFFSLHPSQPQLSIAVAAEDHLDFPFVMAEHIQNKSRHSFANP